MSEFFSNQSQIQARALFLGQRLELRTFEHTDVISNLPLSIKAGAEGLAVLFRYGVVVMFNLKPSEQVSFIKDIQHLIVEPFDKSESEEIAINRSPQRIEGIETGQLNLTQFDIPRMHLVADVLAKSVVLAFYEASLAEHFNRIEPLADTLKLKQRIGSKGRQLLQHIGESLLIESKMTGRAEINDKPDVLWDHPELERLYVRLVDEFDLIDRHSAVERKIELIGRTAETLLTILQNQRTLRVEWYIVILIVVEIVITLIEKLS